ncbi:hypothetical protein NCG89_04295 [Spongiibacter taiwanensis]|uniref:hypothetical protein n=1 Tax=Spongiibacter taiwanensis TaxID=1748242 RepID=UPI0020351F82|nr:hypothetical protein [Spongiibacter taiwanensis]USA44004.1 hypothetical protein NCG89_04295 [Spongiibacter taiwanensis]
MPVTQYLAIYFSRPSRRILLLVIVALHFLVGTYGFHSEVHSNGGVLSLSLMVNVTQFLIIQLALLFLFSSSLRTETSRYSHDTAFFLRTYSEELPRWLFLTSRGTTTYVPTINLTKHLHIPKRSQLDIEDRKDLILSQSVLEHLPDLKDLPGICDVEFELTEDTYQLPWYITENGLDRILKRFNASEKFDYNGLTLSLQRICIEKSAPRLTFRRSSYYSYLATNMLPEVPISDGLTYREVLEPGPKLNSLKVAIPENHLGLSCLFVTSDHYLLIPIRSKFNNVFQGQLSPSVSGAGNIGTCYSESEGIYSPRAWLEKELQEELPFLCNSTQTIIPTDQTERKHFLAQARYLGMSRELRRCGKPEIFFSLNLPASMLQMANAIADDKSAREFKSSKISAYSPDFFENENYLLIKSDEIFKSLYSKSRKNRVMKTLSHPLGEVQKINEVCISFKNKEYVLSESLLINLIFFKLAGL